MKQETMNNRMNPYTSVPVFLAFLCMGFGDAVGPFVGLAKEEFQLSSFVAGLIAFAGFIMFGVLSVPMAVYQDKKGKKHVLMLGLIIALLGLLIPVFTELNSFGIFLITILLLGTGAATLQVAGNPIMRDVSPEGKYSRNLSIGQFVKAIGSLSGAVLPVVAVSWFDMDWKILFPVYSAIILLTIIILALSNIKEAQEEKTNPATLGSCFKLLFSNPFVAMTVFAIFLYVGAEVSVSQGVPQYLHEQFNIDIAEKGLLGTGLFFSALVIGRFLGGVILNWLKPKTFLLISNIISLVGICMLFVGDQSLSVAGFFVIGLGFANIFPLVFSMTIDKMPEKSNELSGLMVTAIVGGAFVPLMMNAVADSASMLFAFVVPLVCILYILYVSVKFKSN